MDPVCNASVLVFGPSKAGKTHFIASGPKPVLILDAEGGSRFLQFKKVIWSNPMTEPPAYDGSWEVCIVYVRDFSTLENVYARLHSDKHPFRSVGIDSISEAQQRCIDAISGVKQMQTQDWGTLLRKISALVRSYRDLLIHPLNPLDCVAFTAMEKVTPEGVHVPYLQGAIANVLAYYLDLVLYYRAAPDETTGQMVRKLLTKPHPQFLAGDRTGRLPTVVENPTLEAILALACDLEAPQMDGAIPDLAVYAEGDVPDSDAEIPTQPGDEPLVNAGFAATTPETEETVSE